MFILGQRYLILTICLFCLVGLGIDGCADNKASQPDITPVKPTQQDQKALEAINSRAGKTKAERMSAKQEGAR